MTEDLKLMLADLKEKEAIENVKRRLDHGWDPLNILEDARKGMEIVGDRFAKGEYFIPDLIFSGEILKQITDLVKPKLAKADDFMLDVNGFEVYNLGVDEIYLRQKRC